MKPEERFSAIEEKLRGLVPPSVSEGGQERFEMTLDALSHESSGSRTRFSTGKRAAAAVAIAAGLAWAWIHFNQQPATHGPTANLDEPSGRQDAGMLLLTSTNRILHRQDDGLVFTGDGSVPHYRYRYQVTDEERVRDPETGTIITLSQPREEIVTVPVTRF